MLAQCSVGDTVGPSGKPSGAAANRVQSQLHGNNLEVIMPPFRHTQIGYVTIGESVPRRPRAGIISPHHVVS
jgi:hypothetical protein